MGTPVKSGRNVTKTSRTDFRENDSFRGPTSKILSDMPLIYFCGKKGSPNETKTRKFLFQKITAKFESGKKNCFICLFFKKKKTLNLTCLFSKGTDKAQPAAKSGKENQEKSK